MSERRPEDDSIDAAGVERLRTALRDDDAQAGAPVDADLVWRAVTQDLPAEERRAVIERVAADPAWAQAWRLAKAMSQAASQADAPAKVLSLKDRREQRPRFWQERPVWGAMAAMLVVLVGAVVVVRQQQQVDPDRIRGGAAEAITSEVPEATALPRDRFVLRWSGVPQATHWSVQVSSEDLKLFHRAERLEQREYTVPASVLAELPAGTRVLWQVEARLPDGSIRRGSTFVNRLQ
ncbi:hypothetical protein [Corallococcus llansteffanensis]|uniref:Anti-sigma factor n=1 Tax=Corallococcus llansteffanensis TaxID=2316731 RepID=A0A3A8QFK7_9BACT|nr:hypothetical protein [Corallococcus llansteffanensis]RKH67489.1 hypothetical protein D7V93_02890 [Corallococcus llansteffanensis]